MHPEPRHEGPAGTEHSIYSCKHTHTVIQNNRLDSDWKLAVLTLMSSPIHLAPVLLSCMMSEGVCLSLTAPSMGSAQHACFSDSPPLSPQWSLHSEHSHPCMTPPAQGANSFLFPSEDSGLSIDLLHEGSLDDRLYTVQYTKHTTNQEENDLLVIFRAI